MVLDLRFNDDGTFKEKDGDFDFGDASSEIMEDILLSQQGHYKEFPSLGVNMYQYLNSRANAQVIARDIIVGLKVDVFKQPEIDLSNYPPEIRVDNLLFETNPKNDV